MIITKKEFEYICANQDKEKFILEVDFGQRKVSVKVKDNFAILDNRYSVSLKEKLKDNLCYLVRKNTLTPLAFFSESSNRYYKLLPTEDWPTVVIGSVPMHRVTRISPKKDSGKKINLLKPYGVVLDTCMGLGYTAILAARVSEKVCTFEIDKDIYFLAKLNPLSRDLFQASNIEIKQKDISQYIKMINGNSFDCIIHDPPTFKISPVLYSASFYRELYRALKRKGKVFHYTPFYGIKRGINFPLRIKGKLKQAGFRIICVRPEEGGIICQK